MLQIRHIYRGISTIDILFVMWITKKRLTIFPKVYNHQNRLYSSHIKIRFLPSFIQPSPSGRRHRCQILRCEAYIYQKDLAPFKLRLKPQSYNRVNTAEKPDRLPYSHYSITLTATPKNIESQHTVTIPTLIKTITDACTRNTF